MLLHIRRRGGFAPPQLGHIGATAFTAWRDHSHHQELILAVVTKLVLRLQPYVDGGLLIGLDDAATWSHTELLRRCGLDLQGFGMMD